MDQKTLFRAYIYCRDMMSASVSRRASGNFGIAVGKDENARIWQRYSRLAMKIENRLLTPEVKVCPICGYRVCHSNCLHRIRGENG